MSPVCPIEILLVEDDAGDIKLTRKALSESKMSLKLNVVKDGVEAWDYLNRQGQYVEALRPDAILLDLNLPRKDGRELLSELKADERFRTIPVVVLTTSKAQEDIMKTYGLGANCFVTKPVGLDQFIAVVRSIEQFWFTVVKLPSRMD